MTTTIEDDGLRAIAGRARAELHVFERVSRGMALELIEALEAAALRSSPAVDGVGEPVAWPEWATDKHIAEGILAEVETILQLVIHGQEHQIAEHTGAITSYAGTLLGREARRHLYAKPSSPTSDSASVVEECGKVIDAMLDNLYGEPGLQASHEKAVLARAAKAIRALSPRSS